MLSASEGLDPERFGIVMHRNNGGGSKICFNAMRAWVLPDDGDESDDEGYKKTGGEIT